MAEALLADVAATALTTLLSAAADPLIRAWGLEDDLKNLKQKVWLAQGLISDAMGTTSTVTRSVAGQRWQEQLIDVVRHAENMLGEVHYDLLRQEIKGHNKVFAKLASTLCAKLVLGRRLSLQIQNMSASVDRVYSERLGMGLNPLEQLPPNNRPLHFPQTAPTVDESENVGRRRDESELVQRLCCSSSNDLSVLAVVGTGGLGKTTLAQLVFKNEQIVKHFDVRIWVTVSDQFDTLRILNDMLQSLTQQNHAFTTIPPLIQKLKDSLGGNKRFLLVLDDVWIKQRGEWETLRNSLMGMKCVGDNKILITTRDTEVASTMGSCFDQSLAKLSEAESWKLFIQKAFAEGGAEETKSLRDIGERLVRKCDGLPLALRVVGGLMYSRKSEADWHSVENNPCWKITEREVIPSLRISFDHLECSALKRCFAFCSIFPKVSVIAKDIFPQCWMAMGFLDDTEGGGDMEHQAEVYFNRLVWSSLLNMSKDLVGTTYCGMHDLVHDLAIDVSKKFCASLGGSNAAPNSIDKAIHLSLIPSTEDELKVSFSRLNFKRLQALYLDHNRLARDEKSTLARNKILGKFKHLRILVLRDWFLGELPRSIGELKQLRYLDISRTRIERLPDSISKLYLLQTIRVDSLIELPKHFGNLISLRYFWAPYPVKCGNCLFIGVGRATGLRTLPCFAVDESKGCRLAELGSLDKLSGELSIYNLERVSGIEASKKANLNTKSNIHVLRYGWDWEESEKSRCNDEGVLEGLQPHSNLKELEIRDFKGRRLASWMTRVDESSKVLQNLVKITLRGCHHCEEIPSLGHLPHLESVEIYEFGSLKRIGSEFYGGGSSTSSNSGGGSVGEGTCTSTTTRVFFPCLKWLYLEDNPELGEWSEAEGVGMQHQVFPRLEELRMDGCPKLVSVPGHFPSLQKLVVLGGVKDMTALEKMSRNLTTLNHLHLCFGKTQAHEWAVAKLLVSVPGHFPSLRVLQLKGFTIVADDAPSLGVLFQSLTSLTHLSIVRTKFPSDCLEFSNLEIIACPHLVSVPDLGSLTQLRDLVIGPFSADLEEFPWPNSLPASCSDLTVCGWEKLKALPHQIQHLSASLTELTIWNFGGLESLPEWVANLSNLKKLTLFDCWNLKSLPSVEAMQRLHRLSSLWIYFCPLLKERCRKGSGPEWPKIAHIPHVSW